MSNLQYEFETAYEKYADMVFRIAVLYLKEPASAEDISQDVFIKLMKELARNSFHEGEHIKHWLIVTTKNACLDALRYRKRHACESIEAEAETGINAEVTVWQRGQGPDDQRFQEVHEALMKLPADLRLVLYLFYFEGYSSAEIAEMLHKNHATIRGRLRTARRRMRILLEENEK